MQTNTPLGIGINDLKPLLTRAGITDKDQFKLPAIYALQPWNYNSSHTVSPFIKIGVWSSPYNRIRKYNQPGIDARVYLIAAFKNYNDAVWVEKQFHRLHRMHRVQCDRGQTELYNYNTADLQHTKQWLEQFCQEHDIPVTVLIVV